MPKTRRQILSSTDPANVVNKEFIIWLLVGFLSHFQLSFRRPLLKFTSPGNLFVLLLVSTS